MLLRGHRCSLVSHPADLSPAVLLACRYRHSPFLNDEEFSKLISEARYVVVLRKAEGFEMLGVEALFSGTRPVVYEAMIETKPYRWACGWGTCSQWLLLLMMMIMIMIMILLGKWWRAAAARMADAGQSMADVPRAQVPRCPGAQVRTCSCPAMLAVSMGQLGACPANTLA